MIKRLGGFILAAMTLTVLVVAGCGGGEGGSTSTTGHTTTGGTTTGAIQLTKTGQNVSYAAGDDGNLQKGVAWPTTRFIDIGDGTMADTLTGLIWAKDVSAPTVGACVGGKKTWQGAIDYVACLNTAAYLGHSDWLLPNINELKSLTDARNSVPSLPLWTPFALNGQYWSSSTVNSHTDYAWFVSFSNGFGGAGMGGSVTHYGYKTWVDYVLPVRAEPWPDSTISLPRTGQMISYTSGDDGAWKRGMVEPIPRFTDNRDGTVTDNRTGLIWLRNANCFVAKPWSDALRSANTLANGSCGLRDGSVTGDWRLPNREELASLIDRGTSYPALPNAYPFSDIQYIEYWSSSTYIHDTGYAWNVIMGDGGVNYSVKSFGCNVWPVRGE